MFPQQCQKEIELDHKIPFNLGGTYDYGTPDTTGAPSSAAVGAHARDGESGAATRWNPGLFPDGHGESQTYLG